MRAAEGKKVLVAMSGGVDSSVTAALLKQDGYDVVGCFMRLGSDDEMDTGAEAACDTAPSKPGHQGCCSVNDAADARLVAAMLEIPLYVLNFKKDFNRIVNHFVDQYNAGLTPNPCVRCNDWLKFDKLAAYARSIDADFLATGHYARVDRPAMSGGTTRLLRGRDSRKDQSYFLFGIDRQCLDRLILPVGNMEKSQVRRLAGQLRLSVSEKPDSQEICFVPNNDYTALIRTRTPDRVRPGDIIDRGGRVIGRHQGQQHFTIGQRRGVAVSLGYPVYVIDKNPDTNTITVDTQEHLMACGLLAHQANWLADRPSDRQAISCEVKIRHNAEAVSAQVCVTDADTFEVRFDRPQRAVTPGQAVVCYRGQELLGGGWISKSLSSDL